jgi:hypothetical protein
MHLFKQQGVADHHAVAGQIPVIDYGPYFADAPGALERVAAEVAHACGPLRPSDPQQGLWPIQRSPGSRARSVRTCQGLRPRRVRRALARSKECRSILPLRDLQWRREGGRLMCGIAGFTNPGPDARNILGRMNATLGHRGPDGNGTFVDRGIALGHTRLPNRRRRAS